MHGLRQIRTHFPNLIFLSETLLADNKTAGVVNRLEFNLYLHSPPPRKWGGLLCMWHLGVDVEPIVVNGNVMALLVYSNPMYMPWLLLLVYCPSQMHEKQNFWTHVNTIASNFLGPILVLGDFNTIIS